MMGLRSAIPQSVVSNRAVVTWAQDINALERICGVLTTHIGVYVLRATSHLNLVVPFEGLRSRGNRMNSSQGFRSLASKFFVLTAALVFWVVAVILAYDLRQDTFD